MRPVPTTAEPPPGDSGFVIFCIFLRLGFTAFGGPVAHLAYFRDELVTRRRWLNESSYASLVALCQFLPGPASSQAGFSLGVLRGHGLMGGMAAWLGFTLPSAIAMFLFALASAAFTGPLAEGLTHGLKLAAVAIVAQAVWGMAGSLAPDRRRAAIAIGAMATVTLSSGSIGQIAAIALGAVLGMLLCRTQSAQAHDHLVFPVTRSAAMAAWIVCIALLVLLPAFAPLTGSPNLSLFHSFYRSGALVFGGGHVVLPLLEAQMVVPGAVTKETFLAGYGMAQAMPGPLFTFAAFLGAAARMSSNPASGAAIALVAVFMPGLLMVYGTLPFWGRRHAFPSVQYAMHGVGAAVVGILGAALYDPVWRNAVYTWGDFLAVLAGFILLARWQAPPLLVVALLVLAGILGRAV